MSDVSNHHEKIVMNEIEIDKQIAPLIQQLWNAGVETTNCCQENAITKNNKPFFVYTSEGNYCLTYEDENNDHRFLAYLVFKKKYYDIVKAILPSDTKFLIGKDCNPQDGMDCLWKDLAWAHWRHYE